MNNNKMMAITCKCGALFAACREPECYTDNSWLKDLGHYMANGCTMSMCDSVTLSKCECNLPKRDDSDDESDIEDIEDPFTIDDIEDIELIEEVINRATSNMSNLRLTTKQKLDLIKSILGLYDWSTIDNIIYEIKLL